MCFDAQQEAMWERWCTKLSYRISKAERPNVDLSAKDISQVQESDGMWCAMKTKPAEKLDKAERTAGPGATGAREPGATAARYDLLNAGDRPARARRDRRIVFAARAADRRDLGAEVGKRPLLSVHRSAV